MQCSRTHCVIRGELGGERPALGNHLRGDIDCILDSLQLRLRRLLTSLGALFLTESREPVVAAKLLLQRLYLLAELPRSILGLDYLSPHRVQLPLQLLLARLALEAMDQVADQTAD
jgi:hypothetical protein